MRDIVKRKRDEHLKMVWRVNFAHKRLQSRIEHMRKFRRQHEQLRTVIVRVLRPSSSSSASANAAMTQSTIEQAEQMQQERPAEVVALEAADTNAIEEVNLAYENVKEVDGLDISKEGIDSWEAAMKRYDDRIDRVEARITSRSELLGLFTCPNSLHLIKEPLKNLISFFFIRLRDQLGTAKNANEMFRIFSRFNALFVRPHIRGAIREYQTQLIQRVKVIISRQLQGVFRFCHDILMTL